MLITFLHTSAVYLGAINSRNMGREIGGVGDAWWDVAETQGR